MLRHGAEINVVDNSGRSALMVAADKGHSGTVGGCHASCCSVDINSPSKVVSPAQC